MVTLRRISMSDGRRIGALLLILALAPGLCLAAPATGDDHAMDPGFAAQTIAAHDAVHCAPDTCCALGVRLTAKRDEDLAPGPLAVLTHASTEASRHFTRIGRHHGAIPERMDPPGRNLPLLC